MTRYSYRLMYVEFNGSTGEPKFSLAPGERITSFINTQWEQSSVPPDSPNWYNFAIVEREIDGFAPVNTTDMDPEHLTAILKGR